MYKNLILILLIIPTLAFASGSSGGYFMLALIFSIPSFVAMFLLYLFIVNQSKKKPSNNIKIFIISFITLFICGICITGYGGIAPNWLAFMEKAYIQPFISSLVLSFIYLIVYQTKWTNLHEINDADSSSKD